MASAGAGSEAGQVGGAQFPPEAGVIIHTKDAGASWGIQCIPANVSRRRVSFVGAKK